MFSVDSFFLLPVHIQHVKNKEKSELQMSLWIVDYFVIKLDDKALYLLHSETVIVLKEYNMCWYLQSKHSLHHSKLRGGKKMIRKFRNFKVKYLITTEFLQGNSLAIQWLGFHAYIAGVMSSVPKIPLAAGPGQKKKSVEFRWRLRLRFWSCSWFHFKLIVIWGIIYPLRFWISITAK